MGLVLDFVKYDEGVESCLVWIKGVVNKFGTESRKERIGTMVGAPTSHGYRDFSIGCVKYYCHRVVWMSFNGEIPEGKFIDHIDGNTSNNRISNLRVVDNTLSCRNMGSRVDNTSGVKGVNWQTCLGYEYARAQWYDINKVMKCKMFSVAKLGRDKAFEMACKYRSEKIEELQDSGAGYTIRHIEVLS